MSERTVTAESLFREVFLPLYPEESRERPRPCAFHRREPCEQPGDPRPPRRGRGGVRGERAGRARPHHARPRLHRRERASPVGRPDARAARSPDGHGRAGHRGQRALQPRGARRLVRRRLHRALARRAVVGAPAALGEPRLPRVASRAGRAAGLPLVAEVPRGRRDDHARRSLPHPRRGAAREARGAAGDHRRRAQAPATQAPPLRCILQISPRSPARAARRRRGLPEPRALRGARLRAALVPGGRRRANGARVGPQRARSARVLARERRASRSPRSGRATSSRSPCFARTGGDKLEVLLSQNGEVRSFELLWWGP